jgi:DNA mismatch endonuclease, patch repair protein
MSDVPRFVGLSPRSDRASTAARGASRKADTRPEVALRGALWAAGYRYRKNVKKLVGCPDIVFHRERVVIFVDGDFWHGKNWVRRRQALKIGHNADYWIRKIETNIARDKTQSASLRAQGWKVIRVWESSIKHRLESTITLIQRTLAAQASRGTS